MNYLLKRIVVGVCIALVMMLVHKVSHAAGAYWVHTGNGSSGQFSSAAAACTDYEVQNEAQYGWKFDHIVLHDGWAECWAQQGYAPVYRGNATMVGTCSTGIGADGSCGPPPVDCSSGKPTQFLFDTGPVGPTKSKVPTNDGFCGLSAYPKPAISSCYNSTSDPRTAHVMCNYVGARDGTTAPNGTAPPPVDPAPDLPKPPVPVQVQGDPGQGCPGGTQNVGTDSSGTPMCKGMGTNPASQDQQSTKNPDVTTNNADGSTTKKTSEVVTNSDGSKTTYTNECVTATTGSVNCHTYNSTGKTITGAQGSADGKAPAAAGTSGAPGGGDCKDGKSCSDLCALHPELNVCSNSQVLGGGCDGAQDTTACTGDAISCAILKQQRVEWCQNSQTTPTKTLGDALLSGSDPMASTLPTAANGQTLAVGSLDQSGFLGGGGCITDKTITLMGVSRSLPFSQVCPYLLPLRGAIMVVAGLVSLAMMRGAIMGG
ncbi:hypothetical protein [Collimonas antrihumi]|uniref:hypothetical protein n=1 Tax=Collimonas antrihumi TaxID=1940615 RepID=UPI001B8B3120|nr:hypothetical protein [Collimonas antrihumi]